MSSFSNSVPSLGGSDTQRPQQRVSSLEAHTEEEEFSLTQFKVCVGPPWFGQRQGRYVQLLISGGSGHLEYLSVVSPVQAAVSGLPALLNLTEVGQSSGTQSRSALPTNFYVQHGRSQSLILLQCSPRSASFLWDSSRIRTWNQML